VGNAITYEGATLAGMKFVLISYGGCTAHGSLGSARNAGGRTGSRRPDDVDVMSRVGKTLQNENVVESPFCAYYKNYQCHT
jgi:hypothetical protein